MKLKLLFASLLFLTMYTNVNATKLTVTVKNFQFTPSDATINLGDTVLFTWINGQHTTTSTTIPSGATPWDHVMDSVNISYTYVPNKAGVYNYQCTPHVSMGHIAKFTVNDGTNISNYEIAKSVFNIFPNPAQSQINISLNSSNSKVSDIYVADVTGKVMISNTEIKSPKTTLDVSALANGMYFIRLVQDGKPYIRKFTISR